MKNRKETVYHSDNSWTVWCELLNHLLHPYQFFFIIFGRITKLVLRVPWTGGGSPIPPAIAFPLLLQGGLRGQVVLRRFVPWFVTQRCYRTCCRSLSLLFHLYPLVAYNSICRIIDWDDYIRHIKVWHLNEASLNTLSGRIKRTGTSKCGRWPY